MKNTVMTNGLLHLCLPILLTLGAGPARAGDIVVQISNLLGGDNVDWSQLGADETPIPQDFSATTPGGIAISGSFAGGPGGAGGGTTAVVCPATPCSWTTSGTGLNAGDTLIWTSDGETNNGPLTLAFSQGESAISLAIQADAVGVFTAQIDLYNGATDIAAFSTTSDANGDPVILGGQDLSGANITSAMFSLTASQGDVNDFAVGPLTSGPEPGTLGLTLIAIGLGGLWGFRRKLADSRGASAILLAVALAAAPAVFAQTNPFAGTPTAPTGPFPMPSESNAGTATIPLNADGDAGFNLPVFTANLAANLNNIPYWTYAQQSTRDGGVYTGLIVGRSPFLRGATTTTIKTVVIPIAFQFVTNAGTFTFDPTLPDPCSPLGFNANTALAATMASPLFQANNTYNYGGTVVGTNVQFMDAFQRAEFWSQVSRTGNSYHTVMAPIIVAPKWTVIATQNFWIGTPPCGYTGVVNLSAWDTYLKTFVMPAYANLGLLAPNIFPIFLFYNVFLQTPFTGPQGGCCVLGYHSAFQAGLTTVQTYSTTAYNTSGAFGIGAADVAMATHEIGEWMNDPVGNNFTPAWGNIGQVTGCQNNLEVGDPLSGTNMPTITRNGFTYHMQELAFYSWFFGPPSFGVNGWYSSNGTFGVSAGPVCH